MLVLESFPQGIAEAFTANWPWVLLTALLAVGAMALFWLVLPRWTERFLAWVDELVPGDFSSVHRPLSRLLLALASILVLAAAGLAIASSLGADTSGLLTALGNWALSVGQWLAARVARVLLVIGIAYVAVRYVARWMPRLVQQYLGQRAGDVADRTEVQKRTKTLGEVMRRTTSVVIVVVAFLVVLSELGVNIAPLLAGAGVAGIAVGFGAQTLIRDFLAGVFILLEDQFRVGDVVEVAGVSGVVEGINLRRTVLRDLQFTVHTVPNSEIRVASNLTKERSRAVLDIQVAYKEDLDRVIAVLNRVGKEMYEDPAFRPLMNEPLQALRVEGFLDSGISIKVMGETKPIQQWTVMGEFRRRVKRVFDEEGIEMPFPHRTLYLGQDLQRLLRPALDPAKRRAQSTVEEDN